MTYVPKLEDNCNSWIVTRKSDGVAVLETFERTVAEAINQEKYDVWTALSYLQNLNRKVKDLWEVIDEEET